MFTGLNGAVPGLHMDRDGLQLRSLAPCEPRLDLDGHL